VVHPQIAAFARLAGENTPPVRTLEGQKTLISRTMHGFGYDSVHDEIVVTSALTQAILIFRGGATGEEPPLRVIQGPHTQLLGTAYGGIDKVSVDGVNGEIYVFSMPDRFLVFDRTANGDVPPKRFFRAAGVRGSGGGVGSLAIDPVNNVLAINGSNALYIFDRRANGDVQPLRTIKGPKTSLAAIMTFQMYPPKGLIITGCEAAYASTLSVCAWSIHDDGDVAPRFKLPVAELSGYQPSGIALDPVHKEIIMSSSGQKVQAVPPPGGIMNAAVTFSWPEIF
jgi:hypothetical protein